ncbi:MAG: stage III sporulation protein AB [Clostridia bacterium]|nr:stage III sporulation protein AB [Clostridia bacterium]
MLKCAVAVLLIGSMWCIGLGKRVRLKSRATRLGKILDGLLCMEGEIRTCLSPIPFALSEAGRYDPLFQNAARLAMETDIGSAFSKAIEEDHLEKAEREVLSVFSVGLTATDERGQLQNLSACRKRLSAIYSAAQLDAARLGRLYSGGGMMLGLLVVILLF